MAFIASLHKIIMGERNVEKRKILCKNELTENSGQCSLRTKLLVLLLVPELVF